MMQTYLLYIFKEILWHLLSPLPSCRSVGKCLEKIPTTTGHPSHKIHNWYGLSTE